MRRHGMMAWIVLLLASGLVRAGVYSTLEPPVGPRLGKDSVSPLPFSQFLLGLETVNLPVQAAKKFPAFAAEVAASPLAAGPLATVVALQTSPHLPPPLRNYWHLSELRKTGALSAADTVNLSYYLIYLGRAEEAIGLLRPLAADRQKNNFMVSANLGTAYLASGNFRAAFDSTQDALYFLKRGRPGWSKEQIDWYRRMEDWQKKLIRARMREASKDPASRTKPPEIVDDLFEVRFLDENGAYQAGRIADAEKAKLPKDAVALTQQLALWNPRDPRLLWLAGEVLNAEGRKEEALDLLNRCSDPGNLNAPDLRRHRQILQEAIQSANTPPPWRPDARKLIAAGVLSLIVVLLLFWQLRETLRRRLVKSE